MKTEVSLADFGCLCKYRILGTRKGCRGEWVCMLVWKDEWKTVKPSSFSRPVRLQINNINIQGEPRIVIS
ncbi:hypothetical protein WN55_10941 [Dufourea novaeangliae]|uniref:Uncharacterized protein n=1 Tax=Dufourea novaeangliae TaxID=178035 RepID=A0A154PAF4_DUFNO|nr:hypothetical protein WN55_10941 [Dufourea novaeangliae]